MKLEFIDFQIHGDERGQLIALEENKNIPFPIKRVYFMYDTQKRGKAHFIMEDNPIYVRVIQGLDKATETVQEFDAEQFWSKICPYIHHNRVDEILKEIDKTLSL